MIEVIVALVVLSATLLVFYDFLSSALSGAERAQRAALAYDRAQNALALARTLNPMARQQGTFDLGSYRIRWSAQPIGPIRRSRGYPDGAGAFALALYRVVFEFPDDPGIASVAVTRLGYRRDRPSGEAPGAVN